MNESEEKCPSCGGDKLWSYGLGGGGDPGYYEFCGAEVDCGYFHKPNSNGERTCFVYSPKEEDTEK